MIKPLESYCIDYLLGNFNAENIFTILQFCIDCQTDARLMDECKQFIRSKTEAVLKAESFPKISQKCLELLLKQKVLTVEELCLFKAVCFFLHQYIMIHEHHFQFSSGFRGGQHIIYRRAGNGKNIALCQKLLVEHIFKNRAICLKISRDER